MFKSNPVLSIPDLFTLTQRCQYFLDDLSVFWGPCQYKSFAQRKGKGNNQMNTTVIVNIAYH